MCPVIIKNHSETDNSHPIFVVSGIKDTPYGTRIVGTRQGVYILDADDQFHKLSEWMPGAELEFLHSRIFDIKEDAERNIWIATNYEGIVRINLQDKTYEVCKHEGKRGRLIACPIYHETSYPVRTSEHEPPFGQPTTGRAIERKSFHIIGYRIIVYVFQYVGFIHGKGKHRIIGRYPYLPPTVFHNVGDSLILYGGERSDSYKHILPAVVGSMMRKIIK